MSSFDAPDPLAPPVKFGRKAQAWLRRILFRTLFKHRPLQDGNCPYFAPIDETWWDMENVDRALDWYIERHAQYVDWVDTDEFRGRGFSSGSWVVCTDRVKADFLSCAGDIEREHDSRVFTTLDAWLKADIENTLWSDGDPGGISRVPVEMRRKIVKKSTCTVCGSLFVPQRRRAARCTGCIEKAKEIRADMRSRG